MRKIDILSESTVFVVVWTRDSQIIRVVGHWPSPSYASVVHVIPGTNTLPYDVWQKWRPLGNGSPIEALSGTTENSVRLVSLSFHIFGGCATTFRLFLVIDGLQRTHPSGTTIAEKYQSMSLLSRGYGYKLTITQNIFLG